MLPVQAQPVTQLHRLSSPKVWIIKTNLWKLQNSQVCCFMSGFVSSFLIMIWSAAHQILNDSGHCIEAWCVPSAICGSWLYQSQNTVLNIGVRVGLLFNCLYYAPSVCSLYSSNPRTGCLPWFHLYSSN